MIKKKPGRPVGTLRGRKKQITIRVSAIHLGYLKKQPISYGKTISRLIDFDIVKMANYKTEGS